MSKLSDLIEARQDRERRIKLPSLALDKLIQEVVNFDEEFRRIEESREVAYDVGVKFNYRQWLPAYMEKANEADLLFEVKRAARLAIIEAVFGEFRPQFHLIRKAIIDRDYSKAISMLNSFYEDMYKV